MATQSLTTTAPGDFGIRRAQAPAAAGGPRSPRPGLPPGVAGGVGVAAGEAVTE